MANFFSRLRAMGLHDNLVDGACYRADFQNASSLMSLRGFAPTRVDGAPTKAAGGVTFDGTDDGLEYTIANVAGPRTVIVWAAGFSTAPTNQRWITVRNSVGDLSGYAYIQSESGSSGNTLARTYNGASAGLTSASASAKTGTINTKMLALTDTNAGGAGALRLIIDGDNAVTGTGYVNAATLTKVTLGGDSVMSYYMNMCVASWFVFDVALSDVEVAAFRLLVESTICPRPVMLCEGDSLTEVTGWPEYLSASATTRGYIDTSNIATGGETSVNVTTSFAAQIASAAPTNGREKWLLLSIGANDVASLTSDSAAVIYARIEALWTAARALGFKVGAFTVTNGAGIVGASRTAVLASLNALIRAAGDKYDVLIDVDAYLTKTISATYYTNPTYFNGDQVHYTTTGKQYVAAYVASLLRF